MAVLRSFMRNLRGVPDNFSMAWWGEPIQYL
jgi:hypothetical protein